MTHLWTLILLPAFVGCSDIEVLPDRNVRSVTIQDHRFEPKVTVVRAGAPVVLTVEGVDQTALIFASPDLGVLPTRLRSHSHLGPRGRLLLDDYAATGKRFILGPLQPGTYELVCDCHGTIVTGSLLAR